MMMYKTTLTALGFSTLMAGSAFAGVSAEEAARLGKDLTPLGAEMAGNADGSIPAWNPAGPAIPADYVPGSDNYTNPYADEKPLFSIDINNYKEYAANMSTGSIAMMEKLGPDGWSMDVYPTHRDFVPVDWLAANTKKNATAATLVADGQKIEGSYPGVPFPIPQSGGEVMWNHMNRVVPDHTYQYDVYYVSSNGKPILSTTGYMTNTFPAYRPENVDKLYGDTPWMKLRINYTAPPRRAGEILLVHEPGADYTEGKGRRAWQYLMGQRRVRLAPAVSFDTPNPGVAGTSTYDDAFLYNGSPERFDWTLIGKKEIYIPESNYDFIWKEQITDMLGKKFFKPEYVRWEKHRVWVVEANLKEGSRHLYSKRVFYVDEDTWNAMIAEAYDGRGNLWRVQYSYAAYIYDRGKYYNMVYGAYDLLQGIYNLNTKPIPGKFKFSVTEGDKYFSPKGMARTGVR